MKKKFPYIIDSAVIVIFICLAEILIPQIVVRNISKIAGLFNVEPLIVKILSQLADAEVRLNLPYLILSIAATGAAGCLAVTLPGYIRKFRKKKAWSVTALVVLIILTISFFLASLVLILWTATVNGVSVSVFADMLNNLLSSGILG